LTVSQGNLTLKDTPHICPLTITYFRKVGFLIIGDASIEVVADIGRGGWIG